MEDRTRNALAERVLQSTLAGEIGEEAQDVDVLPGIVNRLLSLLAALHIITSHHYTNQYTKKKAATHVQSHYHPGKRMR